MKITINKSQQEINFNTHIETIIMRAQQTAQKGMTSFKYDVPRGLGFGCNELINEVVKQTDDSVCGSHSYGTINFCIRN
jgi:hypothetical protein